MNLTPSQGGVFCEARTTSCCCPLVITLDTSMMLALLKGAIDGTESFMMLTIKVSLSLLFDVL
ncbi:hypothetical protein OAE26_01650 [Synechococcus sp. AH-551-E05]|nr:hypothetical protein [Synechococcus sp. AH-551-E05]MDB4651268.1 hypothetical protein [Synechococcus sp. AH-551-E05]